MPLERLALSRHQVAERLVEQQRAAKRGEWLVPDAPTLRRALSADEVPAE